MSEAKRQSLLVTILDKKNVNLEAERQRVLREKDEVIRKFEAEFINDPSGKHRKNVKLKNYVDGSRYEGEVINDKRNGKGIYHYANGDKYAGEWKDDRFHGKGCYIFSNGERYEGELMDGAKHGYGVYHYVNGNKYEGIWVKIDY